MAGNGLVLRHFPLKLGNQGPRCGQFVGPVLIGYTTQMIRTQYIGRLFTALAMREKAQIGKEGVLT